jgi:transposase-like protein
MITLRAIGAAPTLAQHRLWSIAESDQLLLAYEAGASLMTLARALGIGKGTVCRRLSRARRRRHGR